MADRLVTVIKIFIRRLNILIIYPEVLKSEISIFRAHIVRDVGKGMKKKCESSNMRGVEKRGVESRH